MWKKILLGILILIIILLLLGSCGRESIPTTKYEGMPITDHPANDEDVRFFQAHDGTIYFVWSSERGGSSDIWARQSSDGLTWSEPWQITDTEKTTWGSVIVQDSTGNFHMLYQTIDMEKWHWPYLYATSLDMIHWSEPTVLFDHPGQNWGGGLVIKDDVLWVMIGSDKNGNIDLYMMNSKDYGKTWSEPVQITETALDEDIALFYYLDDTFIATWTQTNPDEPGFLGKETEVFFMTSQDGLEWDTPVQLTNDLNTQYVDTIAVALESKDGVEIAWVSGKWSSTVAVPLNNASLENARKLENVGIQPAKIKLQSGKFLMGWPVPSGEGYDIHAVLLDE